MAEKGSQERELTEAGPELARQEIRSPRMSNTMIVILIGVGAIVLLFLLDRLLRWAEARGWIYYRNRKGMVAGMLQEFDPATQAMKRAMEQERSRKDVRPSEDPLFRVDLDQGVVRIKRPDGDDKEK
ncbi:hypothetical protein [Streptomyces sp. NPDC002559]